MYAVHDDGILVRLRRHRESADPELVEIIDDLVDVIERFIGPPAPPAPVPVQAVRLYLIREGELVTQVKDNEKVTYGYAEEDGRGNVVANAPGTSAAWSVGDGTVAVGTDNGDGTFTVAAAGPLGSTTVDLTVTIDPGDGTPPQVFQGSDAFTVVAGDVTQIALTPGAPQPQ